MNFEWDINNKTIDIKALEGVSYIIHLAGAGIADKRWTKKRNKEILSSRIESAQLIQESLILQNIKIKAFISASGVGYYGAQTSDIIFTEEDKQGNDFLSEVCKEWETAADSFLYNNCAERVVKLRLGVVLSEYKNGLLLKMIQPIRYGFRAYLGSGRQYIPWVHILDLCRIIKYVISNNTIQGVYNVSAPEQVEYKVFYL